MNLQQCQQKAIEADADDSAEFDLVNSRGLRSHCRWEDAHLGLFRVLDRPAHLVGQVLRMSIFDNDDGLTVENFTIPHTGKLPADEKPIYADLEAAAEAALDWFDNYGARHGVIPYGGEAVADGLRVGIARLMGRDGRVKALSTPVRLGHDPDA